MAMMIRWVALGAAISLSAAAWAQDRKIVTKTLVGSEAQKECISLNNKQRLFYKFHADGPVSFSSRTQDEREVVDSDATRPRALPAILLRVRPRTTAWCGPTRQELGDLALRVPARLAGERRRRWSPRSRFSLAVQTLTAMGLPFLGARSGCCKRFRRGPTALGRWSVCLHDRDVRGARGRYARRPLWASRVHQAAVLAWRWVWRPAPGAQLALLLLCGLFLGRARLVNPRARRSSLRRLRRASARWCSRSSRPAFRWAAPSPGLSFPRCCCG